MESVRLINFPKIEDKRGNLSFLEEPVQVPFEIKRTYWIYDVPGGQKRGGHAFIKQEELIVALSGSLDVKVDDGNGERVFSLNRSYYGLYIPPGCWREMNNFSTNSVAMVLSSTFYSEKDYIRSYISFKKYKGI
jgi:dTDP-4-dehydrorhamnose 3,5-epimerase-like enzyme